MLLKRVVDLLNVELIGRDLNGARIIVGGHTHITCVEGNMGFLQIILINSDKILFYALGGPN